MLETIHEFAVERLEDSGEAGDIRRRHAEFLLPLAEAAGLSDEAEGPQREDLVRPEADNIRAALAWSLAAGEAELGLRLASALEHYWVATYPFEGLRWLDQLLARAQQLPLDLRARALRVAGGVATIVGRAEEGTRLYRDSLDLYRRMGDERGVGMLLYRLAEAERARGNTAAARSLAEESHELLRRAGFRKGELVALGTLGSIELDEGNHDRGLRLLRESAALAEEVGFSWWKAVAIASVAEHLVELGRLEDAEGAAREALALAHTIAERQFRLFGLALLARIAAQTGRAERAGTIWGAVEMEEARGPVGQWEEERDEYAASVLATAGPEFDVGRRRGRMLTLDEAVERALAEA